MTKLASASGSIITVIFSTVKRHNSQPLDFWQLNALAFILFIQVCLLSIGL